VVRREASEAASPRAPSVAASAPAASGAGTPTAPATRAAAAGIDDRRRAGPVEAGDDGEREITGAGATSTSPWVAPLGSDGPGRTPVPRDPLEEKDTIRNLQAPTGRGLGALVAGACVACAFVAVLALVTGRQATVETARAGLSVPRAPAFQPPPELTETPPPPQPPPQETRPGGEATQATESSARPEPEPHAPAPPRTEPPPAASSDRWF
jgi:hypothetical protein